LAELHDTKMGRKVFEGDIPKAVAQLTGIRTELSRANDLKELQLEIITLEEYRERQKSSNNEVGHEWDS